MDSFVNYAFNILESTACFSNTFILQQSRCLLKWISAQIFITRIIFPLLFTSPHSKPSEINSNKIFHKLPADMEIQIDVYMALCLFQSLVYEPVWCSIPTSFRFQHGLQFWPGACLLHNFWYLLALDFLWPATECHVSLFSFVWALAVTALWSFILTIYLVFMQIKLQPAKSKQKQKQFQALSIQFFYCLLTYKRAYTRM